MHLIEILLATCNLTLIPMVGYLSRLSGRIDALEAQIAILLHRFQLQPGAD